MHLLKICYGANVNCFVFMKKFILTINFVNNDKSYSVHCIIITRSTLEEVCDTATQQ